MYYSVLPGQWETAVWSPGVSGTEPANSLSASPTSASPSPATINVN